MLDLLKSMIGEFTKTTTFMVGVVLIFVSAIVGFFEYRLSLNRKRIIRRVPEGVKLLNAILCGVTFAVSASIEFFQVFFTMFCGSLIGLNGEKLMPAIYSIIPLISFGVIFGVLCFEITKYSGKFGNWFLRKYRKNHRMYIR